MVRLIKVSAQLIDALRSLPFWPFCEMRLKLQADVAISIKKNSNIYVISPRSHQFGSPSRTFLAILRRNSHTISNVLASFGSYSSHSLLVLCSCARTCFRFHVARFSLLCFVSNDGRQTGQSQKHCHLKMFEWARHRTKKEKCDRNRIRACVVWWWWEQQEKSYENTKEKLINANACTKMAANELRFCFSFLLLSVTEFFSFEIIIWKRKWKRTKVCGLRANCHRTN